MKVLKCKIFPDNHVENDPYKVLFGQGDCTCSIAMFSGTHKGSMMSPQWKTILPTTRSFKSTFAQLLTGRTARLTSWNDEQLGLD
jgi:hypothetical protein